MAAPAQAAAAPPPAAVANPTHGEPAACEAPAVQQQASEGEVQCQGQGACSLASAASAPLEPEAEAQTPPSPSISCDDCSDEGGEDAAAVLTLARPKSPERAATAADAVCSSFSDNGAERSDDDSSCSSATEAAFGGAALCSDDDAGSGAPGVEPESPARTSDSEAPAPDFDFRSTWRAFLDEVEGCSDEDAGGGEPAAADAADGADADAPAACDEVGAIDEAAVFGAMRTDWAAMCDEAEDDYQGGLSDEDACGDDPAAAGGSGGAQQPLRHLWLPSNWTDSDDDSGDGEGGAPVVLPSPRERLERRERALEVDLWAAAQRRKEQEAGGRRQLGASRLSMFSRAGSEEAGSEGEGADSVAEAAAAALCEAPAAEAEAATEGGAVVAVPLAVYPPPGLRLVEDLYMVAIRGVLDTKHCKTEYRYSLRSAHASACIARGKRHVGR